MKQIRTVLSWAITKRVVVAQDSAVLMGDIVCQIFGEQFIQDLWKKWSTLNSQNKKCQKEITKEY
jgi:hypothetical protein